MSTHLFYLIVSVLFHLNFSIHSPFQYRLRNLWFFFTFTLSSRVFAATNHRFLSKSFISRIGRIDMSCSAFGHPTLDTFLILSCFAMYSLRRSLLGNSFFVYNLWSKPRRVVSLFRSMAFRHVPISERGSVAVTAVWSECANVV